MLDTLPQQAVPHRVYNMGAGFEASEVDGVEGIHMGLKNPLAAVIRHAPHGGRVTPPPSWPTLRLPHVPLPGMPDSTSRTLSIRYWPRAPDLDERSIRGQILAAKNLLCRAIVSYPAVERKGRIVATMSLAGKSAHVDSTPPRSSRTGPSIAIRLRALRRPSSLWIADSNPGFRT